MYQSDPFMITCEVINHSPFNVIFKSTRELDDPAEWLTFILQKNKSVHLPHRYYRAFELESGREITNDPKLVVEFCFGNARKTRCPFARLDYQHEIMRDKTDEELDAEDRAEFDKKKVLQ